MYDNAYYLNHSREHNFKDTHILLPLQFSDPEPTFVQTKAPRKLKGRKAKVTSIDLDGTHKASGECTCTF